MKHNKFSLKIVTNGKIKILLQRFVIVFYFNLSFRILLIIPGFALPCVAFMA